MASLSDFRYPSSRSAKIVTAILALVLFFFVATAMVSGFLLYHILLPPRSSSNINVELLMGRPTVVPFDLPSGGKRDGLFFPGLRGAPTVILCHGYRSQRSDILTLVSTLQEHQYNVYLFDFQGHGAVPGATTLGYRETEELLAAIRMLATRDDVDNTRFGVWGSDLGAYAALSAAESDARIRAVAAASAYDAPADLLTIEVNRSGLEALPLVLPMCRFGFRMIEYKYRGVPRVSARLNRLGGVPKVFIEVADDAALSGAAYRLFKLAPAPNEEMHERSGYAEMSDDARRAFETEIATFFLQNLPVEPNR